MDFAIKEKDTDIIIFCSTSWYETEMYWKFYLTEEEKEKHYKVKILY